MSNTDGYTTCAFPISGSYYITKLDLGPEGDRPHNFIKLNPSSDTYRQGELGFHGEQFQAINYAPLLQTSRTDPSSELDTRITQYDYRRYFEIYFSAIDVRH